MNTKIYYTNSEEETEKVAALLSKHIPFGKAVALHGDLGTGKTVFARGFIKGFRIGDIVSSPTFTLIKEYSADKDHWIYHLDLYRITDVESALAFGIDEYINDENAVALIEWAERIDEILPEDTVQIKIDSIHRQSRKITIESEFSENLPENC
ncbi:MAG: tRNA (adenosine(37)-N6)-threonylcarbamoyltransferase complex ATPase subunit type 1 TsaE [Victivallales bacterium]|nr:tRNA (adenosine(37)-N6)-threonylcarbamoyltransferase complex ATPase subunit type 1 TsaE [Victivallales bacterium]MCF7888600.1 tRNA (adenosine(37)-N6)-threonylcarbamoyltransferase complex ATPase subunit type 1 TsaE [Victivallales bacterium]